jgi:hypothetical protein
VAQACCDADQRWHPQRQGSSCLRIQEVSAGRGDRHPFGTRTEVAATAFLIGGGLLLAIDDVLIDGERLEGVGVTPTIEVQAGTAHTGQRDLQLDRAVAVLSEP